MRRGFRTPLTAIAFFASFLVTTGLAVAQSDQAPGPMHGMQNWVADHQALLDAKLAGLKAGLKLTPDQEKLWGPFEAAVRSAAEMRMEHMQGMMERMQNMRTMMRDEDMMNGQDMMDMGWNREQQSPVDRLEAMADHMSQAAAAMKQVADAAKPLYASLNDSQKRVFGFLGHAMLMLGHGHGGMGMMGHEHGGMGVMRHGPGGMGDEGGSEDE